MYAMLVVAYVRWVYCHEFDVKGYMIVKSQHYIVQK